MIHPRAYLLACIVLLIFATLACNNTQPMQNPPGTVEATLQPGKPATLPTRVVGTATPTPTVTATPTPSPTPTPLPAVRLEQADRALFNGDYAAARLEYQAVSTGPASQDEIRAAQLGDARAQYRAGAAAAGDTAAADALRAFAVSYPGDPREAEAWFLLGQARMDARDYAGAVEAYGRYLKLRGDLIAPYVQGYIGDALRADKKTQEAIQAYKTALAAAPSALAYDLREKLAGALLESGDAASALAQYDTILSTSKFLSYRNRIQALAVQALDAAGQTKSAHQRRLALVDEYAAVAVDQLTCPYYSNYAYDALVALVDDNVPVDEFKRGLVDYCDGQYDPALAAFTRSIQASHRVAESRYWAGLAFRAQGETDSALRQFNLIIQNFPTSSVFGRAWLEKGKTLVAAKSYADAPSVYREFVTKYPTRPESAEALWRASMAAMTADDPVAALDAWRTLTENYSHSEWNTPALLWQGKAAQAAAQTITATQFFSRAAALDPAGYYGLRAAELLRGDATPLRPVSSTLTMDQVTQRTQAEAWLAARLNITDTTQIRITRADVLADPALLRGLELLKLDRFTEANDEFDAARAAHGDARLLSDAVAQYQLAVLFRDRGVYRQSIAAADALLRQLNTRVTDAPPFLARLVYPAYYADLVVPEAQARQIDPLLVFSLIRQESLFESAAYSSAAAHGLMQIIPATGQEIATALKWPDYSRTDLYKPYISIKFGVYYLTRQRDGFDGDLYAALAAYNGGPGNSARWKAASRGDPDLFYETISYSETRLYLRRISEYYDVYKKLYSRNPS